MFKAKCYHHKWRWGLWDHFIVLVKQLGLYCNYQSDPHLLGCTQILAFLHRWLVSLCVEPRYEVAGSWIQHPESRILDPRSRILDVGSMIHDLNPGSRIQGPGSMIQAIGSRIQAPGSRLLDPGLDPVSWILTFYNSLNASELRGGGEEVQMRLPIKSRNKCAQESHSRSMRSYGKA